MTSQNRKPRFNNACCSWDTFLDGFLKSASQKGLPLLIVDRCKARRFWREGLTGAEAVHMIRSELLKEVR